MTHDELVNRAGRWLLNTKRCKLVIINAKPQSCDEHPDAIGWMPNGESIVVECKVSIEDFRRDRCKRWRRYSAGMGFYKYYMIPKGILRHSYAGIGLLEVDGDRVCVVQEAQGRQERCFSEELSLLVSRLSYGRVMLDGKTDCTPAKADEGALPPAETRE